MTKCRKPIKTNIWVKISVHLHIFLIYMIGYSANRLGILDANLSKVFPLNLEIVSSAVASSVPGDHLTDDPAWQDQVQYEVFLTQNKKYNACLFGDSISFTLGNNLGDHNFNFALPSAMSTVSLIEQLKILNNGNLKCDHAIIAIGTNDAADAIEDQQFISNMQNVISQVRQMGANRITLIPAFYSTLAAINNHQAGTISRVEQINTLIGYIAAKEKVKVAAAVIQPLFTQQTLNPNFTIDGFNLNVDGRKIYRASLLNMIAE